MLTRQEQAIVEPYGGLPFEKKISSLTVFTNFVLVFFCFVFYPSSGMFDWIGSKVRACFPQGSRVSDGRCVLLRLEDREAS